MPSKDGGFNFFSRNIWHYIWPNGLIRVTAHSRKGLLSGPADSAVPRTMIPVTGDLGGRGVVLRPDLQFGWSHSLVALDASHCPRPRRENKAAIW